MAGTAQVQHRDWSTRQFRLKLNTPRYYVYAQLVSLLPLILKYPDWLCTSASQSLVSTVEGETAVVVLGT